MIPEVNRREASELVVCTRCKKRLPDDARFCPYCGRELNPKYRKARRPNGSGSVTKCKDHKQRPWRARISVGNCPYTVGYYATSTEALKALALFEPPDASAVKPEMTLADVYKIVMEGKQENVSKSSMDTYKAAWNRLAPLADKPVADLKPADYQKIIDGMTDASRSSCEKVRIVVSAIGKWSVANELIATNPAQFLQMPKKRKKSPDERETFTRDEIDSLWEDDSEDAHITLAMIYTGMRINELFSLTPADVHIREGKGHYSFIVGGEKTDAGRNRVIVLHKRILPFFEEWKKRGGEFLITNAKGGRMDDRNFRERRYFPMLDRLGIAHLNPHKARHTFASMEANAGADPATLQKLLGHADFSTTANVYHHADLAALKKAIDLLP